MEQKNRKKETKDMNISIGKKNKDNISHSAYMKSPRLIEQQDRHLETVEEYTSDKSMSEQREDIEDTGDLFCEHFFDTRSNSSWSVLANKGGSTSAQKCGNGFSKGEDGINFANYHFYHR